VPDGQDDKNGPRVGASTDEREVFLKRRICCGRLWRGGVTCAAFALLALGCGGSHKSSSTVGAGASTTSGGSDATTSSSSNPKAFATFRVAQDENIDFLDPGLSSLPEGWFVLWNSYLPLIGYRHVSGPAGATLVPYLAEDLPKVSADGRTYRLKLRKGLKYSDGTPVKASDFRASIERDYKLQSPGIGLFSNIEGAEEYFAALPKGTRSISGITSNDRTGAITIRLKRPQGDFEYVLASEFAALVPASSPAKDASTRPLPATGPYLIESYQPNKEVVVVRNPHFEARRFDGNVPAGNPDKVTIDILDDPAAALTKTLDGQYDYDALQPPPDRVARLEKKNKAQIEIYTPANTYYFFMNTRIAPFDSLKVRQAVNYAIDREKLVRIYDGLAAPTENVLPPSLPQYKKLDLYPYNLAKAKQLVRQAGATAAPVTVWTSDNNLTHAPEVGAYLAGVLKSIGLSAKLNTIGAATYWTTIGNQKAKAQIGFADSYQDYPHPLDWFDPLLNGNRITPIYNYNYANFDDPAVNAKIEALKKEPTLNGSVNAQWAALDKTVMEQAPWAPFVNLEAIDTFGPEVDLGCYVQHVNYGFDFATICHK
jgi:peptide/nickel transport system substrate-binding protein